MATQNRRNERSSRASATRARSASSRGNSHARSARKAPRTPAALSLLQKDHRLFKQLVREFRRSSGRRRHDIALTACKELRVHAELEEELFYPAISAAGKDKTIVGEALVEHSVVKGLVDRIEHMRADDRLLEESFIVLAEMVEHHVQDEEQELFQLARRADIDLDDLALQMEERKMELRRRHGLPEEGDLRTDLREVSRDQREAESGPVARITERVSGMMRSASS